MKRLKNYLRFTPILFLLLIVVLAIVTDSHSTGVYRVWGIPIEFYFFAVTLACVAVFHDHTLIVGLSGLTIILGFKLIFDPSFSAHEHFLGNVPFLSQITDKSLRVGEWATLLNLFGLLLGFALLARHFEDTDIPDLLPKILPDDWKGPFLLLVMIFLMSTFLDNIAAAMIGGTIAMIVFRGKVHLGYVAAIVAASNAGGAGSVVGDTTTTMMWIDGVSPFDVTHAFVASGFALLIFGSIASIQQDRYQSIQPNETRGVKVNWKNLMVVIMILAGAITTNIWQDMPALGVWIAIIIGAFFAETDFEEIRMALPGSVFLLSLVTCASLMPVRELPVASWQTAFGLGFVSAVFDNIPLTKLALTQGGYDWGVLAFAVGFGGSMIWFGSSAGVAISNKFTEAKSTVNWIKNGWHVILAYVVSFFLMLAIVGWQPHAPHKNAPKSDVIMQNVGDSKSPVK